MSMNYLAILVASIIGYIIGALWYSPLLFSKSWVKLSKNKSPEMKASTYILGFLSILIFNFVLSIIISYTGASTFVEGMKMGALLWIGFIATTLFGGVIYEKMPMKLFWITSIQYLIAMLIASGILAIWS